MSLLDLKKMEKEMASLKKEVYRKQILATRLFVQRNSIHFVNDKMKRKLFDLLSKKGNQVNHNASILELFNILTDLFEESWNKYEKILEEKKNLINQVNKLRSEIARFSQKQKPLQKQDKIYEHYKKPSWKEKVRKKSAGKAAADMEHKPLTIGYIDELIPEKNDMVGWVWQEKDKPLGG